ncbi:MAG: NAD(P)H-binding protein [Polyangiaceae bacterium]|jgi:divinyl chlorophyllide a 8-vinyl-reductase|nr:NAD(P)H-binding protein [Polyangiaceae bacterium]
MMRVLVAGATGYIGAPVVRELVRRGHEVTCLARPQRRKRHPDLGGATIVTTEVTDRAALLRALEGRTFDAVVSCVASRTGEPRDAWLVDHDANLHLLAAAKATQAGRFVLLSAICVQRPLLEFQRAKLAFEEALRASGLTWSIVRPTAFFKSLAGQAMAVKRGKPFTILGDGELTACKPISERDLARFLVDCLDDPAKQNVILPVGGPGDPITPRQQGALLAELCGRAPRYRRVPLGVFDAIVATLGALGKVFPPLKARAELARIGRYYATESMLVFDQARGAYDAGATPSFGEDTLRDFYAHILEHGLAGQELGDQAVFERG